MREASLARNDDKSQPEGNLYPAMRYPALVWRRAERTFLFRSLWCSYFSRASDHAPRISKPLIMLRINLRSEPYRTAVFFLAINSLVTYPFLSLSSRFLFLSLPLYVSRNSRSRLRTINSRRGFARKWIAFFARHYANENIARGVAGAVRCKRVVPNPLWTVRPYFFISIGILWLRCKPATRSTTRRDNKDVPIKRNRVYVCVKIILFKIYKYNK